jgi:hypothetical protein
MHTPVTSSATLNEVCDLCPALNWVNRQTQTEGNLSKVFVIIIEFVTIWLIQHVANVFRMSVFIFRWHFTASIFLFLKHKVLQKSKSSLSEMFTVIVSYLFLKLCIHPFEVLEKTFCHFFCLCMKYCSRNLNLCSSYKTLTHNLIYVRFTVICSFLLLLLFTQIYFLLSFCFICKLHFSWNLTWSPWWWSCGFLLIFIIFIRVYQIFCFRMYKKAFITAHEQIND